MSVKTTFLLAILFAITAVLAPAASADTETLVLDVQGTDFSVSSYSIGVMPNDLYVDLRAQACGVALFHDVADGTHLGTIALEVFYPSPTLELTYSFTGAIASSFGSYLDGGQVVDIVGFAYNSRTITYPSGSFRFIGFFRLGSRAFHARVAGCGNPVRPRHFLSQIVSKNPGPGRCWCDGRRGKLRDTDGRFPGFLRSSEPYNLVLVLYKLATPLVHCEPWISVSTGLGESRATAHASRPPPWL